MNSGVLKLSAYIKDAIASSGLRLHPFHRRYGFDGEAAIVGATTFRGLVNDPENAPFPDKKTFDGLAVILSKAQGFEVPSSFLMQLCDQEMPEYSAVEDLTPAEINDVSVRADLLVKQFLGLPYIERTRIAPSLLRIVADDDEYAAQRDPDRVAWLIKREVIRRGMGADRFAKDVVGIDPEILRKILAGEKVRLNMPHLMAIASEVHDVNGDRLLEKSEVRQSIFAKVLAPQLYTEPA